MSNNPSNDNQSNLLAIQDSFGALNVFRVCPDNNVYLAAYQHHDTGCWHEGCAISQMSLLDGFDLAIGGSPFQVLRLSSNREPYVVSSRSGSGSACEGSSWTKGDGDPLSNQPFSQIVIGNGSNGLLQLVGITYGDDWIQTIAQQTPEDGWSQSQNFLYGQGNNYSTLVTANGNGGRLQVVGITEGGNVYLAAWQDTNGTWYLSERENIFQSDTYSEFAVGVGNGGNLQVLGVSGNEICLIAWQNYDNGAWTSQNSSLVSAPSWTYSSITPVNGNGGNLQVLALGSDSQIYLAAWQDSQSGEWYSSNMKLSVTLPSSYVALVAGNGLSGLDVIGMGEDGRLYLVARQDADGSWHSCTYDCDLPEAICPPPIV